MDEHRIGLKPIVRACHVLRTSVVAGESEVAIDSCERSALAGGSGLAVDEDLRTKWMNAFTEDDETACEKMICGHCRRVISENCIFDS